MVGEQRPLPSAHTAIAPPETPRSTLDPDRGYYGESPGRPAGGIVQDWRNRGQRLGCLGRQAGFGWVAETRATGKGPEPGHRLARDASGKTSHPCIGKSDEPGLALSGLGNKRLVLQSPRKAALLLSAPAADHLLSRGRVLSARGIHHTQATRGKPRGNALPACCDGGDMAVVARASLIFRLYFACTRVRTSAVLRRLHPAPAWFLQQWIQDDAEGLVRGWAGHHVND
jgi:hypothetical protein